MKESAALELPPSNKGLDLEGKYKRKVSGESSCSTDIAHGGSNTKSNIDERNRSKSKAKFDITYCDCVRKCPRKPNCIYFRKELECRESANDKKDAKETNSYDIHASTRPSWPSPFRSQALRD